MLVIFFIDCFIAVSCNDKMCCFVSSRFNYICSVNDYYKFISLKLCFQLGTVTVILIMKLVVSRVICDDIRIISQGLNVELTVAGKRFMYICVRAVSKILIYFELRQCRFVV